MGNVAELFATWACRNGAHESCGGLGFRVMPGEVDLPCECGCHECAAGPWDGDGIDINQPECTHPEHWLSVKHDDAFLDWDDAPAECRWNQTHQFCDLIKGHAGPHHWPGLCIRVNVVDLSRELAHA